MNRNIYLTFDIDWACDAVISFTLDIIEKENVAATIFITHDTPLLGRMRENPNIELAVHPNFVPYGESYPTNMTFLEYGRERLLKLKELVPEATTLRAHGLTQNTRLLDIIKEFGYQRESNLLLTLSSGLNIKPFYHWNGLLRVPYFWEDDIHCVEMQNGVYDSWDFEPFIYSNCLKIFDFHPIHVFLNTEELWRYEKARDYFHNPGALADMQNTAQTGDRDFLLGLIDAGKKKGFAFKRMDSITATEY